LSSSCFLFAVDLCTLEQLSSDRCRYSFVSSSSWAGGLLFLSHKVVVLWEKVNYHSLVVGFSAPFEFSVDPLS
jgi:hypothetical protein